MDTDHVVIDEYINLLPGDPIRLFPFGKIVKGGKERVIDREVAARFKLPHFDPPVKLGGHDDAQPAGGFIKRLEVRDDGLYAHVELTEKGAKTLAEGDYRYHSPEVVWEGGFEDPTTGEIMEGPFIVGDALLHTPHLGRQAALFTSEVKPIKEKVMSEMVEVPKTWYESILAFIKPGEPLEPQQGEVKVEETEEYQSAVAERDDYKSKFEAMQAERDKEQRLNAIKSEFDTEEFGAAFIELGQADEAAEMLASMTDAQRSWVMQHFKALSAQIKESNLTREIGTQGGDIQDPRMALDAAIKAYAAEHKVDYNTALNRLAKEQPDLFVRGE